MTWRVSEPGDSTDVPVGASYIRENNVQIEAVCTAARLAAGTPIPDYIPVGGTSAMWFYLDAAPVGWTEVAGLGDTLLAVKGGATYVTGGAGAGSWTLPDHTLIIQEMPTHTHSYTKPNPAEPKRKTAGSDCVTSVSSENTGSTGGGLPHNHGSTFRPAARVGIICTKD
jgi:hypothetical protein